MAAEDGVTLAERCAEAMYARDRAAQHLGITVDEVGPGRAVLSMTVVESMLNGHDICHGGILFTLADTAFAYACNAYDKVTVAQHCSISFLQPGRLGQRLVATASERILAGRNGIYDIRITDPDGVPIVEFRGHSRTIQGRVVRDPHPPPAEEQEAP